MPDGPALVHVLHLEAEIAAPIEVGRLTSGLRRVVPITGGTVSGLFTGRVLPGGADVQLIRTDTETEVEARYPPTAAPATGCRSLRRRSG